MNFDKCNPPSSIVYLREDLQIFIRCLEDYLGFELSASSAFRSHSYEIANGRNGSSAHCLGLAIDIYCYSNSLRFKIISFALNYGISRIGIYKNFIHIDIAPDSLKSQNVIWYG